MSIIKKALAESNLPVEVQQFLSSLPQLDNYLQSVEDTKAELEKLAKAKTQAELEYHQLINDNHVILTSKLEELKQQSSQVESLRQEAAELLAKTNRGWHDLESAKAELKRKVDEFELNVLKHEAENKAERENVVRRETDVDFLKETLKEQEKILDEKLKELSKNTKELLDEQADQEKRKQDAENSVLELNTLSLKIAGEKAALLSQRAKVLELAAGYKHDRDELDRQIIEVQAKGKRVDEELAKANSKLSEANAKLDLAKSIQTDVNHKLSLLREQELRIGNQLKTLQALQAELNKEATDGSVTQAV